MGHSVSQRGASDPVRELDNIRPTPAKAGLRSDVIGLNQTIKAAVLQHYGSVKAAAITLDVDPSLMMREFDAGKFGRLERCDDTAKSAIAKAIYDRFGNSDPKALARRAIREARARLDEIAEIMEVA